MTAGNKTTVESHKLKHSGDQNKSSSYQSLLYVPTQDSNSEDLGRLFANYDAVHVLSYAVMMLNTDLHSSQVRKKMTLKVRGGGGGFSHVLCCV